MLESSLRGLRCSRALAEDPEKFVLKQIYNGGLSLDKRYPALRAGEAIVESFIIQLPFSNLRFSGLDLVGIKKAGRCLR